MFRLIPSEYVFAGIYFPPFFLAVVFGLLGAIAISKLFNAFRVGRFFWHPALAFAALWAITTSLIGLMVDAP